MVPRGTHLWPLPLSNWMAEAVAVGLKTQAREVVTPRNASLAKGLWQDVDWPSAKAVGNHLSVRVASASGRRTDRIFHRREKGDLMWIKRRCGRRVDEVTTLHVREIRAQRLQEINCGDALDEGLPILLTVSRSEFEHERREAAYAALLELMGARQRFVWCSTELHAETRARGVNFRDLYAAWWESAHGRDSWQANPWVWALRFETTPMAPEAALKIARSPGLQGQRV